MAGPRHPVLQLDELALQVEELAEIELARFTVAVAGADRFLEAAVVELELELLVEVVAQVGVNPPDQVFFAVRVHAWSPVNRRSLGLSLIHI